jgi:hypothetical protein
MINRRRRLSVGEATLTARTDVTMLLQRDDDNGGRQSTEGDCKSLIVHRQSIHGCVWVLLSARLS